MIVVQPSSLLGAEPTTVVTQQAGLTDRCKLKRISLYSTAVGEKNHATYPHFEDHTLPGFTALLGLHCKGFLECVHFRRQFRKLLPETFVKGHGLHQNI